MTADLPFQDSERNRSRFEGKTARIRSLGVDEEGEHSGVGPDDEYASVRRQRQATLQIAAPPKTSSKTESIGAWVMPGPNPLRGLLG